MTDALRSKVAAVFDADVHAEVCELIQRECGSNLPLLESIDPSDYDRIRFAVVKLSEGKLEALRGWINEAQTDWRDVLTAAGFAWDVKAHLDWNPESEC